jgi:hypothetical protein
MAMEADDLRGHASLTRNIIAMQGVAFCRVWVLALVETVQAAPARNPVVLFQRAFLTCTTPAGQVKKPERIEQLCMLCSHHFEGGLRALKMRMLMECGQPHTWTFGDCWRRGSIYRMFSRVRGTNRPSALLKRRSLAT